MPHLDDESIALGAMGEAMSGADTGHLQGCERCQAELAALRRVVNRVDSMAELVHPPRSVWLGIAEATGVDPVGLTPTAPDSWAQLVTSGAPEHVANITSRDRSRTRQRERRGWRIGLLVAATAAGILAGVGGTLGWQIVSYDDVVLASATLEPLPGHSGSARAELVETAFGRQVDVMMDAEIPPNRFLQVWLMSADRTRMVPIGKMTGGTSAHWAVPRGVTFSAYPVVDVSIEPYDDNPAHSGESLMRGMLAATPATDAEIGALPDYFRT